MKRTYIDLLAIADLANLALAAHKAAKAKHHRPSVQRFFEDLHTSLNQLSQDIRLGTVPVGDYTSFSICDPKPRIIHAACFEDRVLHHAIMNYVAPVLDNAMTKHSYACRTGYGVHRAAAYALQGVRRYPYYLKLDVKAYFASIPHDQLLHTLKCKLKGKASLELIEKIITCYQIQPKRGLPIGSLTSQHFANYYLDSLDRTVAAQPQTAKSLRYMDDILVFCNSKLDAKIMLEFVRCNLEEKGLELKENWQLNKTSCGLSFCGYKVSTLGLGLSQRRRKRYQQRRLYWESLYSKGQISANELQRAGSAVQSITQGNTTQWVHKNLAMHPPIDA